MVLSGRTRLAAVIGQPARHSLSPAIHNAAFEAEGLDWVYLAFEVPEGQAPEALAAMRTLGIVGLSVTMPHKSAVAAAVDQCTPTAAALDAVNCVSLVDGRLVGDNTDGDGFLAGLRADAGFDVAGKDALVLGGGGAARAVVEALARAGARVAVHNRTPARALSAASLAGSAGRVAETSDPGGFDLVVNATPVGMAGSGLDDGVLPCPVDTLGAGQLVVDLVYRPAETRWLAAARDRGAETHNGVSMLVHQAALAFGSWTGREAPVAVMAEAARRALAGS